MQQIELVIVGITGRLGGAVARGASSPFTVAAGIAGREGEGSVLASGGGNITVLGPDVDAGVLESRVVIDCSSPEGTAGITPRAVEASSPMVVATTGHTAQQLAALKEASKSIPVVLESNFSIGMAVIRKIVDSIFPLPEGFDISIVERHNARKRDSPSGTARSLAGMISSRYGGMDIKLTPGPRGERDIEVASVRAGSGGGSEHRILLEAENEEIELRHTTAGSQAYVDGILKAAAWVNARRDRGGLYTLSDVIS